MSIRKASFGFLFVLFLGLLAGSATAQTTVVTIDSTSTTDIVTLINNAFTGCSHNCEVHVPGRDTPYTTTSTTPIVMHENDSLTGDGPEKTRIVGNPSTTLLVDYPANGGGLYVVTGKIEGLYFQCGSATAACLTLGDLVGFTMRRVFVTGTSNGDGIKLQNIYQWMERLTLEEVTVGIPGKENSVGLHLYAPSGAGGGTGSFGYANWVGVFSQVAGGVGVQVDSGAALYNALALNIQGNGGNGSAGTLLQIGGTVSGAHIALTEEGIATAVHVLSSGNAYGCGAVLGPVVTDTAGGNTDSTTPFALGNCSTIVGAGTINNYAGGTGTFNVVPTQFSSGGEENAMFGFINGPDRLNSPFISYDPRWKFCFDTKELYQPLNALNPTWCVDGSGVTSQFGSAAIGGWTGGNLTPNYFFSNYNDSKGITVGSDDNSGAAYFTNASPIDAKWSVFHCWTDGTNSPCQLQFVNDARNDAKTVMTVSRSGDTPTITDFPYGLSSAGSAVCTQASGCTGGAGVSAGSLTGATLASNVVNSSLSSLGTLSSLTNAGSYTQTGGGSNAFGGPTTFGNNVNVANSLTAGSLSSGILQLSSGGNPYILYQTSGSTLGMQAIQTATGHEWRVGIQGLYSQFPGGYMFADDTDGTTPLQITSTGIVAGASSFGLSQQMSIDASGNLITSGNLAATSVTSTHPISGGPAPTASALAGAGPSASVSLASNSTDSSGYFTMSFTSSGGGNTPFVQITFGTAWASAPKCWVTPASLFTANNTVTAFVSPSNVTTTTLQITLANVPTATTMLGDSWMYKCEQ